MRNNGDDDHDTRLNLSFNNYMDGVERHGEKNIPILLLLLLLPSPTSLVSFLSLSNRSLCEPR